MRACMLVVLIVACHSDDNLDVSPEQEMSSGPPPGFCRGPEAAVFQGTTHTTVQGALDAASAQGGPSRVWVCPGTHQTPFTVDGPTLLSLSSYSGDPADTILDGGGVDKILEVLTSGVDKLELSGLTITHGTFNDWGGVIDRGRGNTYIRNCIFSDNSSTHGAVIQGPADVVHIDSSRFIHNTGAISIGSWGIQLTDIRVRNSIFESNYSHNAAYSIGTLNASAATPTAQPLQIVLENLEFIDNEGGPAIDIMGAGARLGMRNIWIDGQVSPGVGGIQVTGRDDQNLTTAWLQDVHISHTTGADSTAYFNGDSYRRRALTATWDGGSMTNNTIPLGAPTSDGALSVGADVHLTLRGVDLGTAPDDNMPQDINNCPGPYGITSGVMNPLANDWCP